MRIVSTQYELVEARGDAVLARNAETGRRPMLGLVPTMGALHAGHRSLLRRMAECDLRVVSIFVNPLQFGLGEDFKGYPRDLDADAALCAEEGVDIVWAPAADEMYPAGFQTSVACGDLAAGWCGAARPGHFDGVATVVAKLFNQLRPDRAYFGEKDYQQLCIVRRLNADLDLGVEVIACPTVREGDGLALSSRNAYLTAQERASAPHLHAVLAEMREAFLDGETSVAKLLQLGTSRIQAEPALELEYLGIAEPDSLAARTETAQSHDRILVAARLGRARLIDNEEL